MRFMTVALLFALIAALAYADCDDSLCESICANFCKVFGRKCGTHVCEGDNCKITCDNGLMNVLANVDGQTFSFKH
ncbi:unnamed protein product [Bursaphelenchus xylophilus]|uniref:(pine wood nematode) hypothetical protein n=1 Tax=Bursaphelenchus xylophilus TaxID=6326 RepID=A0A1I7SUW3_BURXY|nr:unnamed protein product [Bursaphelenchus xylophilus]CAG9125815.1 unnamed protein product [Bursaphelenchus xylophilus]